MKAVLFTLTQRILGDHPIPEPGPGEVLVKNVFVASNPKDWKLHDVTFRAGRDLVDGSDVAGIVHAVGAGVTRFRVGDRVAGFTPMGTDSKYGGHGEYTVVPEGTTFAVPESVGLDEAATVPLAAMTAALALFLNLAIPEPGTAAATATAHGEAIFINGASSSVGAFATQLAKLAGLFVIGTAGAAAEVAREAGADVVIDYRGKSAEELARAVREAAKGRTFTRVFDCISEHGSPVVCAHAVGTGHVALVLPQGDLALPSSVTLSQSAVGRAHAEEAAFAQRYYDLFSRWLGEKKLRGNRVSLMPHGLASVPEGTALLKANKVSGEKLVYRIADTPGIAVA